MKNITPFDDEEQYLINAVENGYAVPVSKAEKEQVLKALHGSKNKAISIRINQDDLEGLKTKAAKAGIPYQTLINSILHRYVSGDILIKDTF